MTCVLIPDGAFSTFTPSCVNTMCAKHFQQGLAAYTRDQHVNQSLEL